MKIFSFLYHKTISWSHHRLAPYYLALVSFAESSFFPIPPDVMLMSMGMAQPQNVWRYAAIASFFSVLGGILGYMLGLYGMEYIEPHLLNSSYKDAYQMVAHWFQTYGIWVIFLTGFSPIPYKIFTFSAGALHMAFLPFVIASWIGRGLRFYLVSALMFLYGKKLQEKLVPHIDKLGWLLLILCLILIILLKWSL